MLDWKIVVTTTLVFVATVMHGITGYIGRVGSAEKAEDIDNLMALLLAIFLGVFEILYWGVAVHKMYRTPEDHFKDLEEIEQEQTKMPDMRQRLLSGGSAASHTASL